MSAASPEPTAAGWFGVQRDRRPTASPASAQGGRLTPAHARRFSRARAGELLCTMNYRGVGCVGCWTRGADGAYAYSARSKSFNSITGMDVSPDGLHIGIATADGEAFLLDAGTLGVRRAVKKAHMIFATSVAFAGDSHAFVSTSGDASARVVTLPEASSFALYIMLLLVLLCGLCAAYVLYAPSSEPPAL